MDTDELRRPAGRLRETGYRQRRRVRGEYRVIRDHTLRLFGHVRLYPPVFEHGFDHEFATGQIGVVGGRVDQLEHVGSLVGVHAAPVDAFLQ